MPMNRFTGRPPMIAATVGTSRTWYACASCGLTLPSTTASTRRPPYDSTTGPRAELRPGALNSTITGTRVESSTTLSNEASFVSKTSDGVAAVSPAGRVASEARRTSPDRSTAPRRFAEGRSVTLLRYFSRGDEALCEAEHLHGRVVRRHRGDVEQDLDAVLRRDALGRRLQLGECLHGSGRADGRTRLGGLHGLGLPQFDRDDRAGVIRRERDRRVGADGARVLEHGVRQVRATLSLVARADALLQEVLARVETGRELRAVAVDQHVAVLRRDLGGCEGEQLGVGAVARSSQVDGGDLGDRMRESHERAH